MTRTITLGESKEREEVSRMRDAVLDFLKGQEEPVSEKEIKEAVEGRAKSKQDALRELVAGGTVEKQGKGNRGDPYLYRIQELSSSHPNTIVGLEDENQKPHLSLQKGESYSHPSDSTYVGNPDENPETKKGSSEGDTEWI